MAVILCDGDGVLTVEPVDPDWLDRAQGILDELNEQMAQAELDKYDPGDVPSLGSQDY